jgi:hypothetical protein
MYAPALTKIREVEMPLSKLLHVLCLVSSVVVLPQIGSAQGLLTNAETRVAAAAAVAIGRSAVVRGVVEEMFGREAAETLLKLPPVELGWKVIWDDRLAGALANATPVSRAGNTENLLASINTLRAFETQADALGALQTEAHPQSLSSIQRLRLLSVAPSTQEEVKIKSVVTNEAIRSWLNNENSGLATGTTKEAVANNASGRSVSVTLEGINIQPGYKIPLWRMKRSTGSLELNTLKWTDAAKGGALGCAVVTACAEGVSSHIKNILGTDQSSHN